MSRSISPEPLFRDVFHVVMADVDMAQVLYYGTPLRWAERILSRWRREVGLSVSEMLRSGQGSPVVETRVTYLRPLRMDEEVEGLLWLSARGQRAYTMRVDFTAGAGGALTNQVWITQVPVEVTAGGRLNVCELPPETAAVLDRAVLNP